MKCKLCKYKETTSSLGICEDCFKNNEHQYTSTITDGFIKIFTFFTINCSICGKENFRTTLYN